MSYDSMYSQTHVGKKKERGKKTFTKAKITIGAEKLPFIGLFRKEGKKKVGEVAWPPRSYSKSKKPSHRVQKDHRTQNLNQHARAGNGRGGGNKSSFSQKPPGARGP